MSHNLFLAELFSINSIPLFIKVLFIFFLYILWVISAAFSSSYLLQISSAFSSCSSFPYSRQSSAYFLFSPVSLSINILSILRLITFSLWLLAFLLIYSIIPSTITGHLSALGRIFLYKISCITWWSDIFLLSSLYSIHPPFISLSKSVFTESDLYIFSYSSFKILIPANNDRLLISSFSLSLKSDISNNISIWLFILLNLNLRSFLCFIPMSSVFVTPSFSRNLSYSAFGSSQIFLRYFAINSTVIVCLSTYSISFSI